MDFPAIPAKESLIRNVKTEEQGKASSEAAEILSLFY